MADAFSMRLDVSSWMDSVDRLCDAAVKNIRPAAQAGAQVLYDEVLLRVPVGKAGHWFHGTSFRINGTKYWFEVGTLRSAIYQAFSADNSGPRLATYHVSWNHRKAPYGAMIENGTSRAPAHPFVRPAFDAKERAALEASKARWEQGMAVTIAEVST